MSGGRRGKLERAKIRRRMAHRDDQPHRLPPCIEHTVDSSEEPSQRPRSCMQGLGSLHVPPRTQTARRQASDTVVLSFSPSHSYDRLPGPQRSIFFGSCLCTCRRLPASPLRRTPLPGSPPVDPSGPGNTVSRLLHDARV
eukprot:scaffold2668_cov319-Prasinococcus_capsulatus_cf.AAC.10